MNKVGNSANKAERRKRKYDKRTEKKLRIIQELIPDITLVRNTEQQHKNKSLEPMNEAQAHYIYSMKTNNLTFGTGPAGTGKTYVCGSVAAEALLKGEIRKIIITRPAVEAGEKLGFLPGELEDKYEPYIQPFRDVLNERMGKSRVDYSMKRGEIEAMPLAYMRGKSFKDAFVILDEAQNTTPTQMEMFLTRIGINCTVVVNGDPKQTDIRGRSGLTDALTRLSHLKSISVVNFTKDDVVRSGFVQQVVEAYEN